MPQPGADHDAGACVKLTILSADRRASYHCSSVVRTERYITLKRAQIALNAQTINLAGWPTHPTPRVSQESP